MYLINEIICKFSSTYYKLILFSPSLSVCPANILVFYFSAIRRDIDLKFIQDTYWVVLNSLKIIDLHRSLKIDLHRSMVKVTGTAHCFLKVQSYHKKKMSSTPLRILYLMKQ